MNGLVPLVATWGPVLLKFLPQIIKVGHDLYALWCGMRGTQLQNDSVLKAMKLLNQHQDNIDRLLQDPAQKRALLEGLTILMNRINQHDHGQVGHRMDNTPHPRFPSGPFSGGDCGGSFTTSSSSSSSFSGSSGKGSSWRVCDVCCNDYNMTTRRPTILICGHTFCRECLGKVLYRGPLRCPTCRTLDSRPLTALPPNTGLLRALEEKEDQNDDVCCSSSGCGSGTCEGMPLTFDQQIEYAILLSQQEAQSRGSSYVEARWREVEVAEDEQLAMALQNSEIFEASRLCAQQRQAEDASGDLCLPKKGEWEECGAYGGSQTEPALSSCQESDEASLLLALELHQQEIARRQRQCSSSSSNGSNSCGGVGNSCGAGWMKEYQDILGTSFCAFVQEKNDGIQDERREEEEEKEEEELKDGSVCCNISQEEERKDILQEDECDRKCNEDDCGKEGKEECREECFALLKEEEELLIQMAIRSSLEQQE